ncbi:hypothetical protein [Actinoallomurus sp. NPDC052274]|uniref:hypothetical protein n=1 Tax=Actinoallomurus sp. NPDC052274 TaxID=3155420 RepID=UPI003448CE54
MALGEAYDARIGALEEARVDLRQQVEDARRERDAARAEREQLGPRYAHIPLRLVTLDPADVATLAAAAHVMGDPHAVFGAGDTRYAARLAADLPVVRVSSA